MSENPSNCPHCGSGLRKWLVPEDASWEEEYFLVCFNNECPYYQRGWEWMKEQFSQEASYRYTLNPFTGASMMIPVWSEDATRQQIVEDEEEGEGDEGDDG